MKNRIDNLIKFAFLCHKTMDADMMNNDPSYLTEKWGKYIGFTPTSYDFDRNDVRCVDYCKRWRISDDELMKISHILLFAYRINDIGIGDVSGIIKIFESTFGSINLITDIPYNGLHPNLSKFIDNWLDDKNRQRDYKFLLLEI